MRRRSTPRSMPGSRTMSKLHRPGRAQRWSAAGRAGRPFARHACRSARRLCISLARRLHSDARHRPMFGWFWRHLRGLGRMFDSVICANAQLAQRLTTAASRMSKRSEWGSKAACSPPPCARPPCGSRRCARLALMPTRHSSSVSDASRPRSAGKWCFGRSAALAPLSGRRAVARWRWPQAREA